MKGVITWLSQHDSVNAEVRLYDRLFTEAQPDAGGRDFLQALNPNSLQCINAKVEASVAKAAADIRFQFERHGYFVTDREDHLGHHHVVLNRCVSLKDGWGKST